MGANASADTQRYREGYPGQTDNLSANKNYEFYTNARVSEPSGGLIDEIHSEWWGDYGLLERHHGYIQWLFPIREQGLNHLAQRLHAHEIVALREDATAMARVVTSYKMMLDFYGMVLLDEETGEVGRGENYRARFAHLNSSFHNYLRITRILKCLGEFGFEHYKPHFVRFIMVQIYQHGELKRTLQSCTNYWAPVLRNDEDRDALAAELDQLKAQNPQVRASDPYARYRRAHQTRSARMHDSSSSASSSASSASGDDASASDEDSQATQEMNDPQPVAEATVANATVANATVANATVANATVANATAPSATAPSATASPSPSASNAPPPTSDEGVTDMDACPSPQLS